jgi:DNA-binding MarR family transcriptional regulator
MSDSHDSTPTRLRLLPTWLLSQAGARAHRLLSEALAASNSRGHHYRLLAALEDLGPASQVDLGRAAGLDRSDVAVSLQQLERRKLVRRIADPVDRRRKRVALTASGRRALDSLDDAVRQVQDLVLQPLTTAERATLTALLARLQPDREGGTGALINSPGRARTRRPR